MNTRDALVAAIIAEPIEDTPRLAFADFIEEEGDTERAAFIRTQIALVSRPRRIVVTEQVVIDPHGPRCWTLGGGVYTEYGQLLIISNPKIGDRIDILKPRTMRKDLKPMYGLRLSQIRDDDDEYVVVQDEESRRDEEGEELKVKEKELWNASRLNGGVHPWFGTMGFRHTANWLSMYDKPLMTILRGQNRTREIQFKLVRGFVGSVECGAEDWFSCGDAIRREQPVEEVTLTTTLDFLTQKNPRIPNRLEAEVAGKLVWLEEKDWLSIGIPGIYLWVPNIDRIPIAKILLGKRWPGIAFHLPPVIDQQAEIRERTLWLLGSMLQIPREDVTRSTVESALGMFQRNPNSATEHMILPLQSVLQDGSW